MFRMQLCQQMMLFSLPQACNCSTTGSLDSQCNVNTGQCTCYPKFSGVRCSECNRGHWNYPHCSLCQCFLPGTDATTCDSETRKCSCTDQTGQCTCKVWIAEVLQGKPSFTVDSMAQLDLHSLFAMLATLSNTNKHSRLDTDFLDVRSLACTPLFKNLISTQTQSCFLSTHKV